MAKAARAADGIAVGVPVVPDGQEVTAVSLVGLLALPVICHSPDAAESANSPTHSPSPDPDVVLRETVNEVSPPAATLYPSHIETDVDELVITVVKPLGPVMVPAFLSSPAATHRIRPAVAAEGSDTVALVVDGAETAPADCASEMVMSYAARGATEIVQPLSLNVSPLVTGLPSTGISWKLPRNVPAVAALQYDTCVIV